MARKSRRNRSSTTPAGQGGSAGSKEHVLVGSAPGADVRIPSSGWLLNIGLCLASAGILSLAFPPLRWVWLAHLGLIPLLVCAMRATRGATLVASGVAGLVFYGAQLHWLFGVDIAAWVGVMLFLLPFWPAFVLLVRWSARRTRLPLVLLAPVFWVALELFRAHVLTGFPWLFLGHAQAASPYLLQMADVTGAYGLSALSAATAGLVVDFITRPLFLRYGEKVRLSRSLKVATAGVVVFWIAAVAYGYYRTLPVDLADGPLVVTCQPNIPQSVRKRGEDKSYEQLLRATHEAMAEHPDADLIVWPETMAPGIINQAFLEYPTTDLNAEALELQLESRQYWKELHQMLLGPGRRADLLVGALSLEPPDDPARSVIRYNSALLLTAADQGYRPAARYDKVHLVPFGEVVPFAESWPGLHRMLLFFTPYGAEYDITAGRQFTRFRLDSVHFATPICFEDAFPQVCRDMIYDADGRKAADFLVNISNDGWFNGTVELEQHWDLSAFRAVENRVPVVRSVNTGISGFIDSCGRSDGRVTDRSGHVRSVEGWAAHRLRLDPRVTFYGRHGDLFACVLSAGAVLIIIGAGVVARRERSAAASQTSDRSQSR